MHLCSVLCCMHGVRWCITVIHPAYAGVLFYDLVIVQPVFVHGVYLLYWICIYTHTCTHTCMHTHIQTCTLPLCCYRNPIDWEDPGCHPAVQREPRRGQRAALRCTVKCSEHTEHPDIVVYCLHLEVFCGMLARMEQMADVMADAKHVLSMHGQYSIAIMGDLNTMAHGIARLSPNYCCDIMRWKSIGYYEAQVWQRLVFDNRGGPPSPVLRGYGLSQQTYVSLLCFMGGVSVLWLSNTCATKHSCEALVNTAGFEDPFNIVKDISFDNPKYRLCGLLPLMKGKLDWCVGVGSGGCLWVGVYVEGRRA